MMAAFAAYIKTITALAVFSALVGLLLPEGKYRRYTELVLGILVLTAVLVTLPELAVMAKKTVSQKAKKETEKKQNTQMMI